MTVADRLALADLVHRYAAAVDDRRFAAAADLFVEDGELVVPDSRSLTPVTHHIGRSAIQDALAAVTAVDRTEHAIVGEVYTGSRPERACGRITCVAHHWSGRDEQITDLVWHLRYDDEYVRTGQNWLFRRRRLTINAVESRPVRRLRPG
ncbi:MAG: nuclear transport factor 2 family protein [Mycobacteriaceae bacterium]|nr:nuclear transport factor 2 family protein [Mycobacteriaceae bacterium]MBV9639854.1 nuclear transport factor 2 family protein [Mycobacteriaceae bacterium]